MLDNLILNATFISHYGIYMESFGSDEVVVYKLNYTGLPVYETPIMFNLTATSFLIYGNEYNYTMRNNTLSSITHR